MQPPVPYYGSKARIAAEIAARFPKHNHYVEVFGGSLAVLLAKDPSTVETVNDVDHELVTFWRVLRDRPDELALACKLTPHSRIEHAAIREPLAIERYAHGPHRDLEIARRVFVALTQGRQGKRTPTGWSYRVSGTANMPETLQTYANRIVPTAARLAHVTIECSPWQDMVRIYGRDPETLLYVDPPYLAGVRTTTTGYIHEMSSHAEHEELLRTVRNVPAAVLVSGYRDPLYDALLRGWHSHEFPLRTGPAGTTPAAEVIWSNRPFRNGVQGNLFGLHIVVDEAAPPDFVELVPYGPARPSYGSQERAEHDRLHGPAPWATNPPTAPTDGRA